MKDQFLCGFVSGLIANSMASLIDVVLVSVFKFGSLRFLDFSSIFIYGGKPLNLLEEVFAQFGELMFGGFLGIIFAYFVFKNKYHLLKGPIYAVIAWFVIYGIVIMYRVPPLKNISLGSSLENLLVSLIYGFLLASTMGYLTKLRQGA
ncbi:hypothetical protein [Candidatus Formimonas warabiya]|uniref:DUF1440 domain-containing protein n=1 Tax=Formimonas warabiya TaxID=1761012 RepID=A0A3G1KMU6_FORW1|nr:hypothetical protein [Candidatus Formimonas warabiya]ATW23812.1 hypothetical protein DCMF_02480 [Candidatus Formimonas warabiya]